MKIASGKIARTLRIFSTQKRYSLLNIIGLSLGMACSILLALYLEHELTYDRHNISHQNIYRVNHEIDATNNMTLQAQTSHFLGPLLIRDYPQIALALQEGLMRNFSDTARKAIPD